MANESYNLREVAELLGVNKRTLQRRIQEGAFPGRYLAPGVAGLEMRIPSADVDRARRELAREAAPIATATITPVGGRHDSLLPYRAGEVESISSGPIFRDSTHRVEVEEIRDVVVSLVREEREMFLGAVRDALIVRDREVADLRKEVSGLRESMEAVRAGVERFERKLESEWRARADRPAAWSEVLGVPAKSGAVDVDDLLRELSELEALVGGFPPD